MKIKLLLTFLLCFGAYTISYASFPVERAKVEASTENTTISKHSETTVYVSPAAAADQKSQGVALLLWFFLGGLAAHRWYLGSPWYWNVLFIITLGGLFVWAVIDLIDIITGNYPAKGGFKGDFW